MIQMLTKERKRKKKNIKAANKHGKTYVVFSGNLMGKNILIFYTSGNIDAQIML